jgi:nucleoid DNA-binding protein
MASRKKTAQGPKPPTKAEIVAHLAEKTKLSQKEIQDVFDELDKFIAQSLRTKRKFKFPGLVVFEVRRKKATRARQGRNPATGEALTIKAKPAHDIVRARPLSGLKRMVP